MQAKDPVCQMQVDASKAAATREHQGTTYYFCAKGCAEEFARNPEKYVKSEEHGGHGGHQHGHRHGGCC